MVVFPLLDLLKPIMNKQIQLQFLKEVHPLVM